MIDRYTKIVLTIIAGVLTVMAIEQATPRASAIGDSCGDSSRPCYVTGGVLGLTVTVSNWPMR